jgi:hypothetical protein
LSTQAVCKLTPFVSDLKKIASHNKQIYFLLYILHHQKFAKYCICIHKKEQRSFLDFLDLGTVNKNQPTAEP